MSNSNLTRGLFKIFKSPISVTIMNRSSKQNLKKDNSESVVNKQKKINPIPPIIVNEIKFEVLPSPTQSTSDKKEYKVIRLENGLTACLISDVAHLNDSDSEEEFTESECEESDEDEHVSIDGDSDYESNSNKEKVSKMAAAALCVGVGSFSDPKKIPGMAHFLEHMVFMGSKKFPTENDFDAFISKSGGCDNASTDYEVTTFYFECLEKYLCNALDKFAQFFISPLMLRNSIEREREAIESEFQMALPSDTYRKEQLLCSFSKPDSPVNSFSWGNMTTLKENVSEDELYETLHEFRKRHYSAHRMTLAIQARLPMNILQSYVINSFSNVPNNNLPQNDYKKFAGNVFDTKEFCKIYYVQPNNNLNQVEMTWALPSLLHKYKSKPHQYVSWLLGYEGKGSLLSYLRKKVWVLSMTTGNGETGSEHNSLYALFSVTMTLTDEGMSHLNEIITSVFSYINMLKKIGPIERIFNEIKLIEDTSFRFSIEANAVDVVEELAENMHIFPSEDYITGSELYFEYDPKEIQMVLDSLVPRKVNVLILTQNLPKGITYDKKEQWFGTLYASKDIEEELLKNCENTQALPDFFIPPPNQFLTEDFTILPETKNTEYPTKIISTPLVEMWFRKDEKFKLPLAHYNFYLINPKTLETPTTLIMLDMFVNLLLIQIVEEVYPAQVAELNFSISTSDKGLILKINGYDEKLHVLIELITKYLKSVGHYLDEELFKAVKDKLLKNYYNKLLKPGVVAKEMRLKILVDNFHTALDRYKAISAISFENIRKFSEDFTKNLYVKVLVQGNVSQEQAVNVINKFVATLNYKEIVKDSYPKFRVNQIPFGEYTLGIENFNKNDANTIISNYYQAGVFSIKNSVILEIIMVILYEPLFNTLRTKEQLGYHVGCQMRETYGILGFTIKVNAQATKFKPKHIDERIESFLESSEILLKTMSKSEFKEIKMDLIKKKQCLDIHLKEEVDRNWAEIIDDDYMFNRLQLEVEALQQLNINDVRKWWMEYSKKTNFRKLSVCVVGFKSKKNDVKNEMELKFVDKKESDAIRFITNISEFKNDLFLYPVIDKNGTK